MKIIGLMTLLALCGCATMGAPFTQLNDQQLKMGVTKSSEVTDRLGKPFKESTMVRNGKTVKVLSYSVVDGKKPTVGFVPIKGQNFYFSGDLLVGHVYSNSAKESSTDFDNAKIEAIVKSKSTISEVEALLGKPQGAWEYPLTKEGEHASIYHYESTRIKWTTSEEYLKSLIVSYGKDGIVTDVTYFETGER